LYQYNNDFSQKIFTSLLYNETTKKYISFVDTTPVDDGHGSRRKPGVQDRFSEIEMRRTLKLAWGMAKVTKNTSAFHQKSIRSRRRTHYVHKTNSRRVAD
jgi:hypothetical protein